MGTTVCEERNSKAKRGGLYTSFQLRTTCPDVTLRPRMVSRRMRSEGMAVVMRTMNDDDNHPPHALLLSSRESEQISETPQHSEHATEFLVF